MKLTRAVWYFFNDVYPPLHDGHSPLDPPAFWIRLFDGPPAPVEQIEDEATDTAVEPIAHDRPPVQAPEVR
jgi:Derlin-2/3